MRSRLILALATLAVVATDLEAQRGRVRPPSERRRPDQPAEKPPMMPGLTDVSAYSRYRFGRFSLEQYPMLSHMTLTGFVAPGTTNSYWMLGDGTHLGFRVAPSLHLTTDFTSSFLGGPFAIGTADFGLRLKPWTSPRFTPFADVRFSHAFTTGNSSYGSTAVPTFMIYRSFGQDFTTARGNGKIFGLGVETRVAARWTATSTVATTNYSMRLRDIRTISEREYTASATRLTVGVKYNHGRWID